MELLHRISQRKIISEKISVKDFLESWGDGASVAIEKQKVPRDRRIIPNIEKRMNVSNIVASKLHESCGPHTLLEGLPVVAYGSLPAEHNLIHLKALSETKGSRSKELGDLRFFEKTLDCADSEVHRLPVETNHLFKGTSKISEATAVLIVEVYRPGMLHIKQTIFSNFWRRQLYLKIAVLAENTLASFCDKIPCVADEITNQDVSENVGNKLVNPIKAKHLFRSRYLFVDDTFYNDLRSSDQIDLSEPIRKLGLTPGSGMTEMKTGDMHRTIFRDLNIRMGYPYLYQHQGNCEHLIVFSELRMFNPIYDSINASEYPIVVERQFCRVEKCQMCTKWISRYLVTNCDRVPSSPFFMCESCVSQYLYDGDGRKTCDFELYNRPAWADVMAPPVTTLKRDADSSVVTQDSC